MKKGSLLLVAFGLLAYWPIFEAHPLMDDHLFFSWLEQTPWQTALCQRVTGNWIPHFNQMQMYRPVSGGLQVLTYWLFGPHPLPHHLFSFLLHVVASWLAGRLAFQLSRDSRVGWCAAGILLLHPRAALGVSLIYNFYDVLATCLILAALLCLWSLKQNAGRRSGRLRLAGLWLCTGLALGVKELALPVVAVLVLADWLWEEGGFTLRGLLVRHSVPFLLLGAYLLARTKAVGHPFRTHGHPSAFPLPANAELWAFSWDLLLVAFCAACAGFLQRASKWKGCLPKEAPWMLLWSGLMFLPAVHFCSQVTLRPWFFDDRYWYVPLVPLSILAGSCLIRGGLLNAGLGAAILAFTLPGWLGVFIAAMSFLAAGPLQFHRLHLETQGTAGVLFAAAMALGTLKQCEAIRLRADEAASVHQAVAEAVGRGPAESLTALLNFNETSVEREASFNGDLQWLLQPPFFKEDLNRRLFFSYSTWDLPPSNRFRDRTTAQLSSRLEQGTPVSIYYWNAKVRKLELLGVESFSSRPKAVIAEPMEVVLKRAGRGAVQATAWRSNKLTVDPMENRYLRLSVILPQGAMPQKKDFVLRWMSKRSSQAQEAKLDWAEKEKHSAGQSGKVAIWISLGGYVDWLLAGAILELVLEAPSEFEVVSAQLSSAMPDEVVQHAEHVNHYRNPELKFEWVGESWWAWGP
ncbi:MAG: hypothetical protein L0387_27280 [Acidobacteria bacterium]|nr:hypothetical protein [Acidobacteriota bacterium]MCI0724120.1 hypothetical protein [Acidobacteriota bacterium]